MSEEVFNRQDADGLTLLIADRLGERQKKLDRMAAWERDLEEGRAERRRTWVPVTVSFLAIAACVVVAFVVLRPWDGNVSPLDELGIGAPEFEDYRGDMPELPEIQKLISAGDYDEALIRVERALEVSSTEVRDMEWGVAFADDDEMQYILDEMTMLNGELRWARIYLLVRQGDEEEALKELRCYLKMPSRLLRHTDEARALRKALKKKS